MSIVRSKICGITNVADAKSSVTAGADALGLVFYEPSPRYVTSSNAREIVDALPPFVTTVGLFVNAEADWVKQILNHVPLDLLQFHGDEPEQYCVQFNRPYIKAIRVKEAEDIMQACIAYPSAQGLLLDTFVEGIPGGTGLAFDWSLVPAKLSMPIILAGGLTPENVAQAIAIVQPYAVDVSGGVEASKGIKDHAKVQRFLQAVRGCAM